MSDWNSQEGTLPDWYSLSLDKPDKELSANFRLVEFASHDGTDAVCVHPSLLKLLENIRQRFALPVHILSGYRTPKHNRGIGGKLKSRHLYGMAADIVIHGVDPRVVAEYARSIFVGGVGDYATFTHVDVEGKDRRWNA